MGGRASRIFRRSAFNVRPRSLATCLLAGAVFGARPARAQTAGETPPGEVSERGGPVVRLRVGPGYLSATLGKGELPAQQYAGAGVAFDAEIGGSVTPTETICAQLSGVVVPSASAGDSGTLLSGPPTVGLQKASAAASFTYTHPSNTFVAASPALTILRITNHDSVGSDSSNIAALAVEAGLVIGHEWRISSGWRLGASVEARYAALPAAVTMSQYALYFSATDL